MYQTLVNAMQALAETGAIFGLEDSQKGEKDFQLALGEKLQEMTAPDGWNWSYGDKEEGPNNGNQLPSVLQKVGVEQHLNQQLPLDAQFVDETGKAVRMGDYFGQHPAIL